MNHPNQPPLSVDLLRTLTISLLCVFLALVMGTATSGCTKEQAGDVARAAWRCTEPERAQIVDGLTPAMESLIRAAVNADGSQIDLSSLSSIADADLLTETGVVLNCALASAFAILEHGTSSIRNMRVTDDRSGTTPSREALQDAWGRIAQRLHGARFETRSGTI